MSCILLGLKRVFVVLLFYERPLRRGVLSRHGVVARPSPSGSERRSGSCSGARGVLSMPWWQRYVAILLTMTLYTSVVHHDHGRGAVLKLETATADLRLQLGIPADEADLLVQLLGAIRSRCHAALRIVARLGRTTHVYLTRIVLDPDHEGISASIIFAHRAAEIIVPCAGGRREAFDAGIRCAPG